MADISVVIFNENNTEITRQSIDNLLAEDKMKEIIIVDNASTDDANFTLVPYVNEKKVSQYIRFEKPMGLSFGLNAAVSLVSAKQTFLLNGSIEYVIGTLRAYQRAIEEFPQVASVGRYDPANIAGTNIKKVAHKFMPTKFEVFEYLPLSPTYYGLYKTLYLQKAPFVTRSPFGKPGHSYVNDWHYQQVMKEFPLAKMLHTPFPLYFRSQGRVDYEENTQERANVFQSTFGQHASYADWTNANHAYIPLRRF